MKIQWIFLILISVVIMLSYQNCSLRSTHQDYSLSSLNAGCKESLRSAYMNTYYSTFRAKCTSCHDSGGAAGATRSFASSNPDQALEAFLGLGRSRVEQMAVNSSHQFPRTGPDNQAMITNAQATWAMAEAAASACGGTTEVITTPKSQPTIYTTSPANNVAWPRITFDLDVDVERVDLRDKVHMIVSLEVRRYQANGNVLGYEFRNPRAQIKTVSGTSPIYRLRGLSVILNGGLLNTMTAYSALNFVASTTTEVNMAPNLGYGVAIPPEVKDSDVFALKFAAIEDADGAAVGGEGPGGGGNTGGSNIPTLITFRNLQSNDPVLGVFSRQCNSCHNATLMRGGFNISDYNSARALASTIQSRMNNFANPMPPSGVLGLQDRTVVDNWISSGATQ